jgi:hypothetical protein
MTSQEHLEKTSNLELADALNATDPRDINGRARPLAQAILDEVATRLRRLERGRSTDAASQEGRIG